MELRPGYKQTDVGVIPDEWETRPIAELSEFVTSGSRAWAKYYTDQGSLFIRSQNIRDGHLDFTDQQSVLPPEGSEGSRTRIKRNDVLITITGNSVGNVAWVDRDLGEAYISQHVGLVRLHDPSLAEFVSLFLAPHSPGNAQIWGSQSGQSKPGLNLTNLEEFIIVLPSSEERNAITAALRDMDALLEGLEQLIAKKRDLKQAAMQQLLTGQTRLPGFSGEWNTLQLGELLTICHGKNQRGVEAKDGPYPILATGGQIGTSTHYLYNKPSVLIGRKGTIDQPQYLDTPFWTVDTLFYSIVKNGNSAKFLYFLFGRIEWKRYNEASGVPSLNAKTVEAIEVKCPKPDEQDAIASALSNMDAELAAFEQRLAKTRDLKQAVMQELLTGKTRLVAAEDAVKEVVHA